MNYVWYLVRWHIRITLALWKVINLCEHHNLHVIEKNCNLFSGSLGVIFGLGRRFN